MSAANPFWESPTYKVIHAMKASGNQPGLIAIWKREVETWANGNKSPEAEAVKAWLPMWHPRPWYSASELAPIFPALAAAFDLGKMTQRPPARLVYELDYGGLPMLKQPSGLLNFRHPVTGIYDRFYIVERLHHWRDTPVSQEDFDAAFNG